jgi:hypothetical protein
MVLKNAFVAVLCTGLLALSGPAMADEYRPSEFLGLDLSKAVLSPKRLGPDAKFVRVPIEAKADRSDVRGAGTVPGIAAHKVKTISVVEKRRVPARVKLARRHHTNPLDAHAADTRIQTWPCKSGGICNWQK